jgi:PAS domain S-box-containing protein
MYLSQDTFLMPTLITDLPFGLPAFTVGLIIALAVMATLWRTERSNRVMLHANVAHLKRELHHTLHDAQVHRVASEHAHDGLVVQHMDGRVIWANPAYCDKMGLQAHQIVGKNPLSFALPQAERPTDAVIARFQYDPLKITGDNKSVLRNMRGDGTLFWNQISCAHHIAPDGQELVVLVCRDVTERVLELKQLVNIGTDGSQNDMANRKELLPFAQDALAYAIEDDG